MDNEFERAFSEAVPQFLGGSGVGKWGTLFGQAVGFVIDNLIEGTKQAARAGMVHLAPPDSMQAHADARLIEPYDGETAEALRERLIAVWDHWTDSSSSSAIRDKLIAYTGATDMIVQTPAVEGINLDSGDASRIWVICGNGGTLPWTQPVVGPGLVVGPSLMVGISMTERELHRIRRLVRRYKPANLTGAEFIVSFSTTAALWAGADQLIRIPLQAQMVGYGSSEMTVGPSLIVGYEYT